MNTADWRAFTETLAPVAERLNPLLSDPQDEQLRQELYRALLSEVASGYFGLLYADPRHPDLRPYLSQAFNILGLNPDTVYYETPIEGGGVYRISGFRGTVHNVDVQVGDGGFVRFGTGSNLGATLANYDLAELSFAADGQFAVVLSSERPAGYSGDWWHLDPRGTYLMVRQVAYDWTGELDARVVIERLDSPAIKPRKTAEEIAGSLQKIALRAESYLRASMGFVKKFEQNGWVNKLGLVSFDNDGGTSSQRYLLGLFDLAPDEALVIDTEIPARAHYWSFQLADELYSAIDWVNRQTTLNGHTARLDADGRFRAVISSQDPGVPNWLDTAAYRRGVIQGRWDRCDSYPMPAVTRLKLDEVRAFLPGDTPKTSAAERDAAIRQRRRGAQLRRRW